MLTTLGARDVRLVGKLMATLADCEDRDRMRTRAGEVLLDLLKADQFASFVWDPVARTFGDRVFLNMDPANLDSYDAYFQFRDPITLELKKRVRATHVNEVLEQPALERTEFFNDFLARDGLHFGMNFHGHDGVRHVGDLRIWRRRGKANFDRSELALLDLIGPAFTSAMRTAYRFAGRQTGDDRDARIAVAAAHYRLTPRETEVARALAAGGSDATIAEACGMSVPTLRTHLTHMFAKTGCRSRAALLGVLL
ncbi:DNA-binding CsgD family transcriptional regulator [Amorphus suaedae]